MNFSRLFILTLSIMSGLGCRSSSEVLNVGATTEALRLTPDGRFGTRCYAWARDSSKELCTVPFGRLTAQAEEYNGRLIEVSGFLINVFDKPVLFENKQSYLADVDIEGIELLETSPIPNDIRDQLELGVFPVVVVGTFDATYVGTSEMRLGALANIQNVMRVVRMPGSGDMTNDL